MSHAVALPSLTGDALWIAVVLSIGQPRQQDWKMLFTFAREIEKRGWKPYGEDEYAFQWRAPDDLGGVLGWIDIGIHYVTHCVSFCIWHRPNTDWDYSMTRRLTAEKALAFADRLVEKRRMG